MTIAMKRRDDPARLARAIALKKSELRQLKAALAARVKGFTALSGWHHRNARDLNIQSKKVLNP